jgi:hypothetical protein
MPDDEDEFEEAILQAAQAANEKAHEFADEIHSEEDFINIAGNYNIFMADPEATHRRIQGGRLDADLRDWLVDSSRAYGDKTIVDSDQGSTIVFFVSRDDNNYRTVAMSQLLLQREFIDPSEFPGGEFDPEYISVMEFIEDELRDRAQRIYEQFNTAGRTHQALLELIAEYSDDVTEDGFYDDIALLTYQAVDFHTMRVVHELESWLFDNRSIGDSELIYTADFGYHLTYFMGEGDIFFEMIARDRMRSDQHSEWIDGLHRATPVRHASFILVHR